ncbi:hypothetical protein [Roseicitreum antarcticum]|uniref:Uncharacterized protein n=1 Tax=Roseicitreum antarcticum TaxID=564137 RepID=A0A1H2X8T6_9RHOB|nr:hypothetical protein [Roseicitreum antarcticum]SDW88679.1 hypothetical protein SAMN04488238_10491 [Roseicitreum antarcticum]
MTKHILDHNRTASPARTVAYLSIAQQDAVHKAVRTLRNRHRDEPDGRMGRYTRIARDPKAEII